MTPLLDLSLYPPHTHIDHEGFLTLAGCRVAGPGEPIRHSVVSGRRGRSAGAGTGIQDALTSRTPHGRVLFASEFPHPSVMALVAEGGCGLDVAGLGELLAAERAGGRPGNIVLHGNLKSDAEIAKAIEMRLQLHRRRQPRRCGPHIADGLRAGSGPSARQPGHQAETDAKMATGHDASKFGIPSHQVDDAIRRIRSEPLLDLRGLHAHVGSQILNVGSSSKRLPHWRDSSASTSTTWAADWGSATSAPTPPQASRSTWTDWWSGPSAPGNRHWKCCSNRPLDGRSERVTVYRVVTVKRGVRTHVAVDGGMADNLEVALYGQPFEPSIIDKAGRIGCDVVGRQCESGDTFVTDHALVDPQVGDLLVIPATGAYTFTLSNNYNGALRPPVVFCEDGRAHLAVRQGDLRGTPGSRPTLSLDAAESICRAHRLAWSVIGIGRRQVGLYAYTAASVRTRCSAGLADLLTEAPADPFTPDIVAVPTRHRTLHHAGPRAVLGVSEGRQRRGVRERQFPVAVGDREPCRRSSQWRRTDR